MKKIILVSFMALFTLCLFLGCGANPGEKPQFEGTWYSKDWSTGPEDKMKITWKYIFSTNTVIQYSYFVWLDLSMTEQDKQSYLVANNMSTSLQAETWVLPMQATYTRTNNTITLAADYFGQKNQPLPYILTDELTINSTVLVKNFSN